MTKLVMPDVNDRDVRLLEANIEASCVVLGLKINKTLNTPVNLGMTPALALARHLIFFRRNGAEE